VFDCSYQSYVGSRETRDLHAKEEGDVCKLQHRSKKLDIGKNVRIEKIDRFCYLADML
jgi:hypothetical protein